MSKNKTDLDILGSNIAKYRKAKNLTQEMMAELLYISDKTISKWETGRSGPDVMIISDVADVLGVDVSDLLSGTSKNNKDRKIAFVFNYIFSFIFIIILTLFIYVQFNSWNVHDFKSTNENFFVSGYVISNKKESRFVIDSFSSDNYLSKINDISSIEVNIYVNDTVVYSSFFNDDEEVLTLFLKDMNSVVFRTPSSIGSKDDLKKFYIVVSYVINDRPIDTIIELE